MKEFLNLIEYLIITKKEIYTLSQLRAHFKEISGDRLRSIDVKSKLQERFKEKIMFCKPSQSHDKTTEFVLSSDSNIMPDTINAVATGQGITSCLQLKTVARSISEEIQYFPKKEWPPTPQVIMESTERLSKMLFNFIAWIVSPNSYMDKDGSVKLSTNKATIVTQICENINALVPSGQPLLSQVLLSLTMYAKTGSQTVVDDLKKIGSGISYTETRFILDKWAEWAANQSSIIPGNIRKFYMSTHTSDNIDWVGKCGRLETHLTNSILVQKDDLVDELSNVTLKPDYKFS